MSLRDLARPLVCVSHGRPGQKWDPVVPLVPAPVKVAFTPATRSAGWRQAELLQEQQRRLQYSKGVR